ncbi:TetR family transcriptional regulator [Streptomyces sp. Ag109_O5-1]|nr:TetR family transcriptional regulator [Streptomyces sp. Ag109_O5-1]
MLSAVDDKAALNAVKLSSVSTERRAPLDRRRVADTALRLLNEVGLEGLTLRAIARELDVKAPALYWHFKDKQALLDEMATEMYRRMVAGTELDPADTWQDRLRKVNRGLRTALLGYRDGAKVFSGSRFTSMDHAPEQEANLRVLAQAGLTLAQAAAAGRTTHAYTIGFVTEEQGVVPLPGERREGYDVEERARLLADFPLAAAVGREIFTNYAHHFEEGLELVIAGIGARYEIN